jgi:hypothetical protein
MPRNSDDTAEATQAACRARCGPAFGRGGLLEQRRGELPRLRWRQCFRSTILAIRRVANVEADMPAGRLRIAEGGPPDLDVSPARSPEDEALTGLGCIAKL